MRPAGNKLFETAPERRDAEKNAKNDDNSATPTAPNPETPNEGQRTEGAAMPESVGAKPVDETSTEERTRTLKLFTSKRDGHSYWTIDPCPEAKRLLDQMAP